MRLIFRGFFYKLYNKSLQSLQRGKKLVYNQSRLFFCGSLPLPQPLYIVTTKSKLFYLTIYLQAL